MIKLIIKNFKNFIIEDLYLFSIFFKIVEVFFEIPIAPINEVQPWSSDRRTPVILPLMTFIKILL